MRAEMPEQQILAHGKIGHDRTGAAGPRRRSRSRRESPAAGLRGANGRAVEPHLRRLARGRRPNNVSTRLRAPRPDKAAEAEDFAAMQIERDVAHAPAAR